MRAFLLATAAAIGLAGCTTVPAPAASAPPAESTPVADEDARIADLVARMSPERKVAQLIQPQIGSFTADDMRRYRFGSYLNGGNRGPYGDEFAPASQWLRHADEMYLASVEPLTGGEPVIPTMWGTATPMSCGRPSFRTTSAWARHAIPISSAGSAKRPPSRSR